jgi:ligand-binding sensor domain-containing protein
MVPLPSSQKTEDTSQSKLVIRDMAKVGQSRLVMATGSELKAFDLLATSSDFQELQDGFARRPVILKSPTSDIVYVGTSTALYELGPTSKVLKPVLSDRSITALAWDHDETALWIGTSNGEVLTWTLSETESPVAHWSCPLAITVFQPMPNRQLWIGTEDLGLFHFEGAQELSHFQEHPDAVAKIPSNHITSLLLDKRNRLWVGS